jgi:hypothetical protein
VHDEYFADHWRNSREILAALQFFWQNEIGRNNHELQRTGSP